MVHRTEDLDVQVEEIEEELESLGREISKFDKGCIPADLRRRRHTLEHQLVALEKRFKR